MNATAKVWGIHAGKLPNADNLFSSEKLVALGWPEMGDLREIGTTREAFKKRVAEVYPNVKPGVIPNNAGQLFRFVHTMKRGDLVVYFAPSTRLVQVGRVTGDYEYRPTLEATHPNTRAVDWMRFAPRSTFTQGALYELGSAMSFFQISNYADEFRQAAAGTLAPSEDAFDETVPKVAADIEETTKDFVLRTLDQQFKGHPFAEFFAELLNAMGWRTRVSPPGTDQGVDILAHKDELRLEPPIMKVQVKSGAGAVGDPIVSQLYGKVGHTEYGLVVTPGYFSPPAKAFASQKPNLRLVDGEDLVALIFEYYEKLDDRYKRLLPLKRVYIPDVLTDVE